MKKLFILFLIFINTQSILANDREEESEIIKIININNIKEVLGCFDVFRELYQYSINKISFFKQIVDQKKEGYQLACIVNNDIFVSCINFRITTLISVGKIVYISDLVTKSSYQKQGHAKKLIQYVSKFAKDNGCIRLELDSTYNKYPAHKFYLNRGFKMTSHHFLLNLQD